MFAISGCDTHFKSKLLKKLLLFYCMLYTDCQTGKTAAIALHVICSNHLFVIADFNNFTAVPAQCG